MPPTFPSHPTYSRSRDPRIIYQEMLDQRSAAISDGDGARYARLYVIPHRIETVGRKYIIETEDQLLAIFRALREHLKLTAIVEVARDCTRAEYVDSRTIDGCHETRLIQPNLYLHDSYTVLSRLCRDPDGWRFASSQYLGTRPVLLETVLGKVLGPK